MLAAIQRINATQGRSAYRFYALILLLVVIYATTSRLVPSNESDRGIFVSVAERLLAGDALYVDVYDNKDPLFYYLVAIERSMGGMGEYGVELVLLLLGALSAFIIAKDLAPKAVAFEIAALSVPFIITGPMYYFGYTQLPGIVLTLAGCALCIRGHYALAGLLMGVIVFLSILCAPVYGIVVLAIALREGRLTPLVIFALAGLAAGAAVLGIMFVRGELSGYVTAMTQNVSYANGSLIPPGGRLSTFLAHLQRVRTPYVEFWFLAFSILVLIALQCLRKGSGATLSFALAAFAGAVLVLGLTGLWDQHGQVLVVASVLALCSISPLLNGLLRGPLRMALIVGLGFALGGGISHNLAESPVRTAERIRSLDSLSPETERLLASGPVTAYARLGTNDDQAHAIGLSHVHLACPIFHQYGFQDEAYLAKVLECARTAPALIIAKSLAPEPDLETWNAFVAKAEAMLAQNYTCDAPDGLRICRRN